MRQVILYKTHKWCNAIELDVIKLMTEAKCDFYVILHDEDDTLACQIMSEKVRSKTMVVTECDIKGIYSSGFINMFLSNHWLLMWFYKQYDYDYYWTIEYDVKVLGKSERIWNISSKADLLYPMGNRKVTKHNKYCETAIDLTPPLYAGFIQLARYSARALDYLDSHYYEGRNAQDEIAVFTLLRQSDLTLDPEPLGKLIKGTWAFDDYYHKQNLKLYRYLKDWLLPDEVYIIHPVKPLT